VKMEAFPFSVLLCTIYHIMDANDISQFSWIVSPYGSTEEPLLYLDCGQCIQNILDMKAASSIRKSVSGSELFIAAIH
jgi:hypothetical protein